MKLLAPSLAALLLCAQAALGQRTSSPSASPEPSATDAAKSDAVHLRARALEFAGALSNEGFNLRDGFWAGRVSSVAPRLLAVNLFAGNCYWFCVATPPGSAAPRLAIYDSRGNPLKTTSCLEPGLEAASLTPATTGEYFVEVSSTGAAPTEFCLLYLFR